MDVRESEKVPDYTGGALEFNIHVSLLSRAFQYKLDHVSIRRKDQGTEINDEGTIGESNWENYSHAELHDDVYTEPILPNGQPTPSDLIIRREAAEVITDIDLRHLVYIVHYIRERHPEYLPGRSHQSLQQTIMDICGPNYWKPQIKFFADHNLLSSEEFISSRNSFEGVLPRPYHRDNRDITARMHASYIFLNTQGVYIGGRWFRYDVFAVFLSTCYSAIHLAAWSDASLFDTGRGWQVACIMNTTFVLIMFLLLWLLRYRGHKPTDYFPKDSRRWDIRDAVISFSLIFIVISRWVIITMSFLSMSSAPIGAFWTPAWIQMIPHA